MAIFRAKNTLYKQVKVIQKFEVRVMCPLSSEINTPPYYRDLMAAPMGSPFMFNELGTGFGMGMYPMCGAYGAYFPPYLYGVRLKGNPSRDTFVKPKEDIENKNNLKKFLKYAGIAIASLTAFCLLKGGIIKGVIKNNGETFWSKLFKMDHEKILKDANKQGFFSRLFNRTPKP